MRVSVTCVVIGCFQSMRHVGEGVVVFVCLMLVLSCTMVQGTATHSITLSVSGTAINHLDYLSYTASDGSVVYLTNVALPWSTSYDIQSARASDSAVARQTVSLSAKVNAVSNASGALLVCNILDKGYAERTLSSSAKVGEALASQAFMEISH